MLKKYCAAATMLLLVGLFPADAFAGDYAWGIWSTDHDKAMKSAFILAEAKVVSRGKGCIGRGKDDNTTEELRMEEKGDKARFGVFYSHNNGSCRIKKTIIEDISRETGIDVNRIIGAWVGG